MTVMTCFMVPSLITKVDSLETELKQTKLTMGKALVKLLKKVKKMEDVLKRRHVVLPDSEDEDAEISSKQGRNLQEEGLDEMSVDKGKRYKRRKESKRKDIDTSFRDISTGFEDISTGFEEVNIGGLEVSTAPKRTKEQIQQEEASLAEAIRLQTLEEEETAKQVHLDALLAKRMEEEELTEKQKQRKAQIFQQGERNSYQIIRENRADTVYMSFRAMLKDFTREDLIELYRLVMQKYGTNRSEYAYDRVLWSDLRTMFDPPLNEDAIWSLPLQQKMISWRYYDKCAVHCLTLEACNIYVLADRKYPLLKDDCQVMLKMKLLDGKMNEVCYKLLKMIEKQAGEAHNEDIQRNLKFTSEDQVRGGLLGIIVNRLKSGSYRVKSGRHTILESHVDVAAIYDTWKKVCSRWKWTSNGSLCSKGDFNTALYLEDHSYGSYEPNASIRNFKECVQAMEVLDVNCTGLHFTWNQKPKGFNGILKKIDKIMGNIQFNDDFSGSFAIFQPYRISDHSPYVLRIPMVVKRLKGLKSPFCKLFHDHGNLHKRVNNIRVELDEAQKSIDRDPLSPTLREEHGYYLLAFKETQLDKERFLKQKAKVEWLEAGDSNTAYFHKIMKSKCTRNRIEMVCDAFNIFYDGNQVPGAFVAHYDQFLGTEGVTNPLDDHDIFIHVLDTTKANYMVRNVTDDEVKSVIFSMGDDRAPCPDGKIIANHVKEDLGDIVSIKQSAFVPGCRIYDNILLMQELIRNYHRRRGPPRCAFKVDIQKAYKTVDWKFLETILVGFGFHPKMVQCIMVYVSGASYSICVNGNLHGYFKGKRDDLFLFARGHPNSVSINMDALEEFKQVLCQWADVCLLKVMLSIRDIMRLMFSLDDSVSNLISDGAWKWSPDWVSRFPSMAQLQVPFVLDDMDDVILWCGPRLVFYADRSCCYFILHLVVKEWKIGQEETSSPDQLVQVILSMVRLKLDTFKFKKMSTRSHLLLDQWKIPSYCIVHDGSSR
ncbi:sodium/hydrogen exchanger 6 [Tanacetum coccineum]